MWCTTAYTRCVVDVQQERVEARSLLLYLFLTELKHFNPFYTPIQQVIMYFGHNGSVKEKKSTESHISELPSLLEHL